VYAVLKPTYEQWLDRRLMKPYYIGDDNKTVGDRSTTGYWSGMDRLFDSLTYCLQPNTYSIHSTNVYQTHSYKNEKSDEPEWTKPFYFTMDLGIIADISRFWLALGTHSRNDRFWEFSHGSPYDFELWGTTTDFAEGSIDYVPENDPYWTSGEWKLDKRWRYMGRYYNKRPNVQGDTPGNYSTPYPKEVGGGAGVDKRGEDLAWDISKQTREMGYGVRYLQDGSGPVQNDEFYFPDASVHYAVTETAVGPVRYVRWQINEVWEQLSYVRFSELWYWGGIPDNN
jgi:hypothetical protein